MFDKYIYTYMHLYYVIFYNCKMKQVVVLLDNEPPSSYTSSLFWFFLAAYRAHTKRPYRRWVPEIRFQVPVIHFSDCKMEFERIIIDVSGCGMEKRFAVELFLYYFICIEFQKHSAMFKRNAIFCISTNCSRNHFNCFYLN